MHFNSVSEFFAMGGHAFYVWWAFGISFLLVAILTTVSIFQRKLILKKILKQHEHSQRIKELRQSKKDHEPKT